jgi:hypothetical protein
MCESPSAKYVSAAKISTPLSTASFPYVSLMLALVGPRTALDAVHCANLQADHQAEAIPV